MGRGGRFLLARFSSVPCVPPVANQNGTGGTVPFGPFSSVPCVPPVANQHFCRIQNGTGGTVPFGPFSSVPSVPLVVGQRFRLNLLSPKRDGGRFAGRRQWRMKAEETLNRFQVAHFATVPGVPLWDWVSVFFFWKDRRRFSPYLCSVFALFRVSGLM